MVEGPAYEMALLHAHKYSNASVGGIFLGRVSNSSLHVAFSVPLVHGLPLSPLLEVSLPQVSHFILVHSLCRFIFST